MQIVLKRGSSGYPCPQLRHEPTWLLIDAPASTTCAVAETYDVELGVFQQAEHHVGRRLFACIFPAELLLSKPDRERSDAFGRRQRVSIFGDSVNRPFLALFIHSDRLPFEHRALRATEDIPVRLRLWWYLSRQFDFGILRHDWFPVRQDYPVLPQ